MLVQHGVTRRQLDELAPHVGRLVEHFGEMDLVLPLWWHVMYAFAAE